jgi:phospholipase A1
MMGWRRALAAAGTALLFPGGPVLALPEGAAPAEEPKHFYSLELHKPTYLLTAWDAEPHGDRQEKEVEFQFSFKKRLLNGTPLYFAYTQRAMWQIYDQEHSRPFRTQNHNPELFLDTPLDSLLGGRAGVRLGVEHESNGMATASSRSWDRAYVWPRIAYPELEHLTVEAKAWWRFPESKKRGADDPRGDDNPDIEDYLGHGELHLSQFSRGAGDALPYRRVALMFRDGTRAGTETLQVDLEYHLHNVWHFFNQGIYLHVQYFYGYGESLIDYNRRVKKLGVGFSFY